LDSCVFPGQRGACDGLTDTDACDYDGLNGAPGLCRDGICIRSGCGDGFVLGAESCDGENLGASSNCTDLGYIESAPLSCAEDCTYDQTECTGFCGDGIVAGGEFCDDTSLDGKDCTDLGFYNPEGLSCTPGACVFDTSACTGSCGDGEVSGGESCDAALLDGKDCTDLGFYNPAGLACNGACVFDTSACTGFCGDGEVSDDESCDTANLNGLDCTDLGFYDSTGLACTGLCAFDTSACTGFCGDSSVNGSESCDGADLNGLDCTNLGFYYTDGLGCNAAACVFDTNLCTGSCGDSITDTLAFETCDDGVLNSNAPDAACRTNCQTQRCGDGILDVATGENCDDGASLPGDGCSGQCIIEECGNGIVDLEAVGNGFLPAEDCDDFDNGLNHDGCGAGCVGEQAAWQSKDGTSPPQRYRHTMVYDAARNRVVLFGGSGPTGLLNDTWEWDGASWTERTPISSPTRRYGHAMAYDASRRKVVLFGGSANNGAGPINETWEWDGTTWTQIFSPASGVEGRAGHAMVYDAGRRRVILFGGRQGRGDAKSDTWEWDGVSWTQLSTINDPPPRYRHRIAYDAARGRVVLFGGGGGGGGTGPVGDTWELNGTTWTQFSPLVSPPGRHSYSLAFNAVSGKVVLFAGTLGNSGGGTTGDTWEWDGATWSENTQPTLIPPVVNGAMAYDTARNIVVAFGGIGSGFATGTWELGDTGSWAEVAQPPLAPSARIAPAVTYDVARGKIVLFGGKPGTGSTAPLGDTWEWDGISWTQMAPSNAPPPRYRSAIAYDTARRKVILYGGSGGRPGGTPAASLTDTWEWDGTNWTEITPPTSPTGERILHAMTYDAARERVVLFGGRVKRRDGGGAFEDTWEWDGTTWTEMLSATAPPARYRHSLVYDPIRRVVVLFGGSGGNNGNGPRNDTWEWDGTDWTQRFPATVPPARQEHSMAFNPARGRTMLFGGGTRRGTAVGDSWEWDGTDWVRLTVIASATPAERRAFALAYDAARQKMLLFGGQNAASAALGDTHTFQFSTNSSETCSSGGDSDNDGMAGCADPDCWSQCTPECPPNSTPNWPSDCSTAAGVLRCGDGLCIAGLENSRICPVDCGAGAAICGDFFCDPSEDIAGCPGDCTP
jgi:cysteine-rich repeat protein